MMIHALASVLVVWLAASPLVPFGGQAIGGEAGEPTDPIDGERVWVRTDDCTRLWAVSRGRGEPTILVPNGVFLEQDFAWLAARHRVVFFDLRNRGRSESLTDAHRLSGGVWFDVSDTEAVRRHFALDRIVLLGHSYLGAMVILYAKEHPEHVERIVQIGPIGPAPAESFAAQLAQGQHDGAAAELGQQLGAWRERATAADRADDELCRQYWSIMGRILTGDPAHADEVFREVYCELENEAPLHVERHFTINILPTLLPLHLEVADLEAVRAPALVIHGTADRAANYDGGRAWAARLPDARLLTVEGAGHLPWLESPQRVRSALDSFLGGVWPEEAKLVDEPGDGSSPPDP